MALMYYDRWVFLCNKPFLVKRLRIVASCNTINANNNIFSVFIEEIKNTYIFF